MGKGLTFLVVCTILVSKIDCKVQVSFKLKHYENLSHRELDGDCCDFFCGSCDNRFNLCFDVYGGDNDMASCAYGNLQIGRIYSDNDNFEFPSTLPTNVANPHIFSVNAWSTGFRSKVEVWDYDPSNSDDKIDYYGYNYQITPDRTSALATSHAVTLTGAGRSTTTVEVKVYCAQHYYNTGSGCSIYCVARDDAAGHYDCDDFTGAKMCHPGWQGEDCNMDINECNSNPCQYSATCTNLLNDFRCTCPAGTMGKTCDNINECSSNPCENEGICTDYINYYSCACPDRYTGKRCEFEIDYCDPSPCLNGATCIGLNDDTGVVECTCAPGFTNTTCDVDIDDCNGVECLNNGTCVDQVNGFTCNCSDGYGGLLCEMDIRNECASNPCLNNASCVDEINGYVCVCPPGFQSDNCQENVDECNPNPCVYGNCTDRVNRYTCDCFVGYTGVNCSENIDDCVDNLCQNNSTCRDGLSNYTCDCVPGYSGAYCQTDIDECASEPCQHGGICEQDQLINNFTCNCDTTNYKGALCEIDENECELEEPVCREDETCVNLEGTYICETTESTTPIPGLCRTKVCYNDGNCSIVNNTYRCNCPSDFSGELCETPTALCSPNPCLNSGFCRVNTVENGSVFYECRCEEGFTGANCQAVNPGARTGAAGGFQNWYIILIVIAIFLIVVMVVIGMYIYRVRRNKPLDCGPTVYENHTAPSLDGATAAPALPPRGKLDKLGEYDASMTFENRLYSDIDEMQIGGASASPDGGLPPYSKENTEHESPYAAGGYTPMSNGHIASPRDDSQYESARDHSEQPKQKQNEYSVEPTTKNSFMKPFGNNTGYSTIIEKGTRPESTNVPIPNDYSTTIQKGNGPESVPRPQSISVPNDYSTTIHMGYRPESVSVPQLPSPGNQDHTPSSPSNPTPPGAAGTQPETSTTPPSPGGYDTTIFPKN